MLEALTIDTFLPTLDQEWTVQAHADLIMAWTLISATPLGAPPAAGTGLTRQAFSLVWRGPAQPILPQAIYQLRHPALSAPLDVFLVPLGPDNSAQGIRYEAVFT